MQSQTIKGLSVATGIAVGRVQVLDFEPPDKDLDAFYTIDPEIELARFRSALAEAETKLHQIKQLVESKSGERDAMIFQAQLLILRDETAQKEIVHSIQSDRLSAELAVLRLMESFNEKFKHLADSSRDWASEVRDPWSVVLQLLHQREESKLLTGQEKVILVTEELTPSLAMYLERAIVLGLIGERGGKYSHGAILARSFGIPAVSRVDRATSRLVSGMLVIVNGDAGTVILNPAEEELKEFKHRQRQQKDQAQELLSHCKEPAITKDGKLISIQANIESMRDFEAYDLEIVDGVGLLRTEFLFMERSEMPSEDEQVRIYSQALKRMQGKPVTFRTLDVGGDKPLPMLKTPAEKNPALGWRGLRISLEWRDLLIVQLRAMLKASEHGPIRILLPMVTNVEEVRTVLKLLEELRQDLNASGQKVAQSIPLGIMIEVPAMAYLIPFLVDEIDFISFGTNDLIQYMLAVDRDNSWVASLYEPYHPAIFHLMDYATQAAIKADKEVAVCGEMAGDPYAVLMFFAMGIRQFSMSPHFVPMVKATLCATDSSLNSSLRNEVLKLGTATEIRNTLHARYDKLWKSLSKSNRKSKTISGG